MATIKTAYYLTLEKELNRLLAVHGFKQMRTEDGTHWESPRSVSNNVYRRIGKIERLMNIARHGKAWEWEQYAFVHQSRIRGVSERTLNKWYANI